MKLLFVLAHWHGLAKLRLHTDATLDLLRKGTASLGQRLREFRDKTCSEYLTHELQREAEKRQRREQRDVTRSGAAPTTPKMTAPKPLRLKTFSINTVKFHFIGDYVQSIAMYGTTDGFSSQSVRISSGLIFA